MFWGDLMPLPSMQNLSLVSNRVGFQQKVIQTRENKKYVSNKPTQPKLCGLLTPWHSMVMRVYMKLVMIMGSEY